MGTKKPERISKEEKEKTDAVIHAMAAGGMALCPYCTKPILIDAVLMNNIMQCRSCFKQQFDYYTGKIDKMDFGEDQDVRKDMTNATV